MLAVLLVFAAGVGGARLLLRALMSEVPTGARPVGGDTPVEDRWGVREVVTLAVDVQPDSIELLIASTDPRTQQTWRLVGDVPPARTVATLERWYAASTSVVLCVEPSREASLHASGAHVAGLRSIGEAPDAKRCPTERLPLNVAEVAGQTFLWVVTGRGTLLHLTARVDPGRGGRPAADRGPDALAAYDTLALLTPAWTARTLCGLRWEQMAAHESELDAWTTSMARGAEWCFMCPVCAAVASGDVSNPYHPG